MTFPFCSIDFISFFFGALSCSLTIFFSSLFSVICLLTTFSPLIKDENFFSISVLRAIPISFSPFGVVSVIASVFGPFIGCLEFDAFLSFGVIILLPGNLVPNTTSFCSTACRSVDAICFGRGIIIIFASFSPGRDRLSCSTTLIVRIYGCLAKGVVNPSTSTCCCSPLIDMICFSFTIIECLDSGLTSSSCLNESCCDLPIIF